MSRRRPPPLCNRARRWSEPAHRSFVSEGGEFVVTIDRFADEASEGALVILGPNERVVRRFRPDELLTRDEIAEQRDRTTALDWWYRRILFDFSLDGATFQMKMETGRRIHISLRTGELLDS